MSSELAIQVQNLGKCYHIYDKPVDRLKQFVIPPVLQALGRPHTPFFREFWALNDVSFEVKKGEVVGIIGRNGSGKSTLLQLICGTLHPTQGQVMTSGRISALLELGSGFNPEFSGRENVYMGAAVLGLSPAEIEASLDDILAFADIGDFIDQPVKTYSSGMFVRLAFAVAVHVKPDILVVDEALSVGDIAFRNKCMEVIQKLVAKGVTILFVTHDLGTLQLLCSRVIWLSQGELRASGNPVRISQDYYTSTLQHHATTALQATPLPAQQNTGKAQFLTLELSPAGVAEHLVGSPLNVFFSLLALEHIEPVVFTLSVYRADGDWVVGQTSADADVVWPAVAKGSILRGSLNLKPLSLAPGDYLVAMSACSKDYSVCYALTDLVVRFSVRSAFPTWGKFIHPIQWTVEVS